MDQRPIIDVYVEIPDYSTTTKMTNRPLYVFIDHLSPQKPPCSAQTNPASMSSPIQLVFPPLQNSPSPIPLHVRRRVQALQQRQNRKTVKLENYKKLRQTTETLKSAFRNLSQGNVIAAFSELADAIDSGTNHADIYYLFGETSRLRGLTEQAEKYLLKALRFAVHSPYCYYSLGLLKLSQGKFKESAKLLFHFVQVNETAEGHFALSQALKGLTMFPESLGHISRAIELSPEVPQYHLYKAQFWDIQRNGEKDSKYCREANFEGNLSYIKKCYFTK